jgi:hypothetical protein
MSRAHFHIGLVSMAALGVITAAGPLWAAKVVFSGATPAPNTQPLMQKTSPAPFVGMETLKTQAGGIFDPTGLWLGGEVETLAQGPTDGGVMARGYEYTTARQFHIEKTSPADPNADTWRLTTDLDGVLKAAVSNVPQDH